MAQVAKQCLYVDHTLHTPNIEHPSQVRVPEVHPYSDQDKRNQKDKANDQLVLGEYNGKLPEGKEKSQSLAAS